MIKKYAFYVLIWCVTGIVIIVGFYNAAHAKRYANFSLRYATPVSGQVAYDARLYAVGREDAFWPTFWREYTAEFSNDYVTVNSIAIAFSGSASMVWPADYINGNAPGETDITGVAVSDALAFKLWGSTDVIGMTVKTDGVSRVVRGVFSSEYEMALVSFADKDFSWNAVELSGGSINTVRNDAENFAAASGLGRPASIISAGIPYAANTMALAPVLLLFLYGFIMTAVFIFKQYRSVFAPGLFSFLIIFAFLLPQLLDMLPAWAIPTMWSDFSFWNSLIRGGTDSVKEFLGATPYLKDVELKWLLIKQSAIMLFNICGSIIICQRWK